MIDKNHKNIIVRNNKHVGYIELNNPEKLNAISFSMWCSLNEALEGFYKNSSIRCIVVSGVGKKAFSDGADISEFEDNRSDVQTIESYDNASKKAMLLLQNFPKPTVACISGYCMGGGMALALSCDIRIASEESLFGIPAAKLGLAYGFSGIKRLTSIVGPSRAKYIFFTAGKFNARQAKQYGILEEVYSQKDLNQKSKELVNSIALNAPLTIKSAKLAVDTNPEDNLGVEECLKFEKECFASEDYIEGRKAFTEKRKPLFKGK